MSKQKKVRVEFRRNRTKPPRENDITRDFHEDAEKVEDTQSGERVRAKGDISRHRTVILDDIGKPTGEPETPGMPAAKDNVCVPGL